MSKQLPTFAINVIYKIRNSGLDVVNFEKRFEQKIIFFYTLRALSKVTKIFKNMKTK